MSEAINIRKEVAGEGSPAESPEFASGEPLDSVKIDKTQLVNPENNSVPKASDVRRILAKLDGITRDETKVVPQVGTNVFSGKVRYDDGTTDNDEDYKYLEIEIPQGTKSIRLLAFSPRAANWTAGYAFGNLVESEGGTVWENVFSSRFEENGVANTAEEREIPVEDGAAYFRVTCQVVYNNTTYLDFADFYCYLRSGESVKDFVDDLAEGLAGKLDTSDSDDPDNLNSYIPAPNLHHYLDRDGKERTSNNVNSYGVTDFIPVDDMFGIICNNSYNSSVVCGCAVYSTNDESGFLRANTGTIALYKEIYAKKEGDAFVRFTLYNSSNIWIRKYNPTRLSDYTETPIHDYPADKLSAGTTVNGVRLFEISESVNLFDKTNNFISNGHLYINEYGTLSSSNNAETIGVTGFIPFGNHGKVTIKNGGLSGALRHCTYDANFVKKRDVTTSSITKAEDEYYVRFTVKSTLNADTCVIYYDNNAPAEGEYPPYSPQPHFNEKLIPKKPVTVDDFSQTMMEPISDNLCDPEEIVNGYIRGDTGVLVNSPSNNSSVMSCSATGYIPIDEEGLYCEISKVSGEIVGYAYYTDKTSSSRIDGYYKNHKPSGCSVKYAAYIEGAKYVRFTISRGSTDVMVSRGGGQKDYVAYAGFKKVISPEILPESSEVSKKTIFDDILISVPNDIYITKDDEVYLYHKSIIKAADTNCVAIGVSSGTGIREFPRYIKIKGNTVGNRNITLNLYTNNTGSITQKTVKVHTIAKPTLSPENNVNILLIGASRMESGETLGEMMRRLTGTGGTPAGLGLTNIRTVGQRHGEDEYSNIQHQAQSGQPIHNIVIAGTTSYDIQLTGDSNEYGIGDTYSFTSSGGTWTFKITGSESQDNVIHCSKTSGTGTFANVFAGITEQNPGTLTRVLGDGSSTMEFITIDETSVNPFWHNGGIDFEYYASNCITPLTLPEKIDILIISRMANDFSLNPERTPQQVVEDYVTIVDAFHAYNTNGKVIINTEPLPSPYGGLGLDSTTYPHPKSTFYCYASLFWRVYEIANEEFSSGDYKDFVIVSSTNAEFDLENLYPTSTIPTGLRGSKTEVVQNNALHYTTTGKFAVADTLYHAVCKCINDFTP